MPAGLTIFNTGSTVQIDENWKNYGFRQKIPVTLTAYATSPPNPSGYNGPTYDLYLTGSPQLLVACKASVLKPAKLNSYYDGTTWMVRWLFLPPTPATYTETVEFYVFDAMNSSYSNVGMEVFNAAGERVYHTDAPVMKLGSVSSAGVQGCNTSFFGDAGKTYVPLIVSNPLISFLIPGTGFRLSSYALRSMGTSIEASTTTQWGIFAGTTSYNLPGLYAAIDVTGLS